jgi:hypothetical protein
LTTRFVATIEATLPEMKGSEAYKTGRGKSTIDKANAVRAAFDDIQTQLGRKQFTTMKAVITVVKIKEPEDGDTTGAEE